MMHMLPQAGHRTAIGDWEADDLLAAFTDFLQRTGRTGADSADSGITEFTVIDYIDLIEAGVEPFPPTGASAAARYTTAPATPPFPDNMPQNDTHPANITDATEKTEDKGTDA
eukprot:1706564-Alexandrium_andersonii.AAC.1